jgi:hypothetical protein
MKDPRSLKARLRCSDFGHISQSAFVRGWIKVVGEPPAALLDDRSAMIEMLVETAGIAPTPWESEAPQGRKTESGLLEPELQFSRAPAMLRRAS